MRLMPVGSSRPMQVTVTNYPFCVVSNPPRAARFSLTRRYNIIYLSTLLDSATILGHAINASDDPALMNRLIFHTPASNGFGADLGASVSPNLTNKPYALTRVIERLADPQSYKGYLEGAAMGGGTGTRDHAISSVPYSFQYALPMFSGEGTYTIPKGLYTVTDSTELGRIGATTAFVGVHPSAVHHSTTDLAHGPCLQRLVEVDSAADNPQSFSTAFMRHASLAADAYPIHFLPDLRTSRIQMTPHLSVHVDVESNTSVFKELLGFNNGHCSSTSIAETTYTAQNHAIIDRGNRALAVHCDICTGGYSASGKAGSSCIGSFPITVSPGMVQTYAPSAEPFKSHAPVGGALISLTPQKKVLAQGLVFVGRAPK